jgi:hypothetical protein
MPGGRSVIGAHDEASRTSVTGASSLSQGSSAAVMGSTRALKIPIHRTGMTPPGDNATTASKGNQPQEPSLRPDSPRTLLQALQAFTGDEEALREHFEEIARERQRQHQKDGLCAGSTRG